MGEEFSNEVWKKLQQQASHILEDDFWQDIGGLMPQRFPRVDIYESGDEIVVEAELPGLTAPNDVKVGVDRTKIALEGVIRRGTAVAEKQMLQSERTVGKFSRQLELPVAVDPGKVSAKIRNGLLEIRLGKQQREPFSEVNVDLEE